MPDYEGQNVAGYDVVAKLGQGGMGAVYKARQPALNRLIALKVLPAHLAEDKDFVARFKREASAAASLNHTNIVQVYAAGESNGVHYIAMEFVEGESLQKRIERNGRLDPSEALACCYYVAEALRHAWNHNQIIHRDIKPDNVFLSDKGDVKVGDLGLAKRVGGETTGLTQTGTTMGSPHYVSPEQAQGKKDIDFRADIYSLGCSLYHMITGKLPYDGTDAMSIMMKHVNEPPPAIFKVWPTCPMPLALLLGKMLKKNPRERHASYEELIAEIVAVRERVMGGAPATPVPAPAPQQNVGGASAPRPSSATTDRAAEAPPTLQKPPVALYAAAAVAALAVIGGVLWWAPWKAKPLDEASPRLPGEAAPAASGGTASAPPASDFAKQVAVAATPEQQIELVTARLKEINGCDFETKIGYYGRRGIENGKVTALELRGTKGSMTDLSPLAALTDLKSLAVHYMNFTDFSGLRGLKLEVFEGSSIRVKDLSAFQGMPLVKVIIGDALWGGGIDPSALAGAPLETLILERANVPNIEVLKSLPLKVVNINGNKRISSLDPLRGKALIELRIQRTGITDLSLMRDMPLKILAVDDAVARIPANRAIIEGIASLTKINDKPPAEFWKALDAAPATVPAPLNTAPQTIDLLSLIDPAQDRLTLPGREGKNEWGRVGTSLVYKTDGKSGKVAAPVRIAAPRCEFEISYRRTSGLGRLHLAIPLHDGNVLPVYLDFPGKPIVADKDCPAWPASTPMDAKMVIRYERGTGGTTDRVEVQPEGATPMVWSGDASKFARPLEAHPAFPGEPVTSLFAFADGYEIRGWTLRVFEGEAKVLRGGGAPTSPAGALTFGGHRYQAVSDPGAWSAAKAKAEAMGGHLVVITSKEENDWIRATFIDQLDDGKMLWIGATNSGPDGKWKWVTGERVGFAGWVPKALLTQPNVVAGFVRNMTNKDVTRVTGWAPWRANDPAGARQSGFLVEWEDGAPSSDGAATGIATATKDAPFVNSLGMKFVPVPGTKASFSVWLTRVQDYAAYAAANPQVDGSWKTQDKEGVPIGREQDHPVVAVSWDDAQAFCAWLTAKEQSEGKLPKDMKYRLPSDEEWSWAVGLPAEAGATPEAKDGKNSVDFPWGKVWPPPAKAGNYADEAFHAQFPKPDPKNPRFTNPWIAGYTDGYATTSPVGSLAANRHGLHDMGGNVWQWCEDGWNTANQERVLRGNSFPETRRERMLSSARHHTPPGVRYGNHGFRCVLAPTPGSAPAPAAPSPSAVTFGGHRYLLVNTKRLTWLEAKAQAEKMGGHLVTLTTAEENQFATALAKDVLMDAAQNYNAVWIGLSEPREGADWQWVTGEVFSYAQWLPGEPSRNQHGGGWPFCVNLWHQKSKTDIGWNDHGTGDPNALSQSRGFIVEWDDGGAPSSAAAVVTSGSGNARDLFNGRDFTGWTGAGGAAAASAWTVQGSVVSTTQRTTLWSEESFGDFELEIEWKVGPKGNGGIFYHVPGANELEAPEMQLADPTNAGSGLSGSLFGIVREKRDASNPVGEWNTAKLVVNGPKREHWINDELVCSYDVSSADFRQKLDASRMKTRPDFAANRGKFVLQANAGEVSYRNARIRVPGAAPAAAAAPSFSDARTEEVAKAIAARLQFDATGPFETAVAALNRSHLTSVAGSRATAQLRGALAEVNAADEETRRIQTGEGVPATDAAGTPPWLATLRAGYRRTLAQHAAARDAKSAQINQLHVQALDVYVVELTKANRIEDAKRVRALRNEIAQRSATTPSR